MGQFSKNESLWKSDGDGDGDDDGDGDGDGDSDGDGSGDGDDDDNQKKCLQQNLKVSPTRFHNKCPHKMSKKSVHKNCQQKLSPKTVHKKCPQKPIFFLFWGFTFFLLTCEVFLWLKKDWQGK